LKPSQSQFIQVRGLRYHIRTWGREGAPKLFLIHGWMDVSASFQFFVDALKGDWQLIAPDWRGYGLTQRSGSDTYWYGDFIADLDQIFKHYQADAPVKVVAHSFGASVTGVYAGIRPERIEKFVNIDAYGAKPGDGEDALRHYRRWIKRINRPMPVHDYATWTEMESRMQRAHPRVPADRIHFLARHWAAEKDGRVVLSHDPAHARNDGMDLTNRLDEAMAAWREVTAPTLIFLARQGGAVNRLPDLTPGATTADRFGCFRNHKTIWFEDTGHMMHLERPAELAPIIETFMDQGLEAV
jgi:pimeloyl-ACP methyl ester carboxylesterase